MIFHGIRSIGPRPPLDILSPIKEVMEIENRTDGPLGFRSRVRLNVTSHRYLITYLDHGIFGFRGILASDYRQQTANSRLQIPSRSGRENGGE